MVYFIIWLVLFILILINYPKFMVTITTILLLFTIAFILVELLIAIILDSTPYTTLKSGSLLILLFGTLFFISSRYHLATKKKS
ncbi:hypothetical protein MNBD_GAMMA12-2974 [hydrothermal vent metagenome]|uniref:Uncharacterized protein n=1 Tax=hydrothermal vent metagenome TaxID=652676 RepID=A0A3B0Y540_9ZZZZ